MRGERLAARAHARATRDLVAEAGALAPARGLESERLQAQPMLVGEPAQRRQRGALGTEYATQRGDERRVELGGTNEAQGVRGVLGWIGARLEHETAQLARPAQLAVEYGREILDQPCLEQQRTELARGALEVDTAHLARELHFARRAQIVREVGQDARAHRDALADVKRHLALAVEQVNAGCVGNGVDRGAVEVGGDRRLTRNLPGRRGDRLRAVLVERAEQELPDRVGIAECTMARAALETVARDQAVQIVACMLGIQTPRQAHGAQHACIEVDAAALECVAQKAVIEARVVCDEHAPGETRMQVLGEHLEARGVRHHLVGDSGQRLDRGRDRGSRIDERRPLRAHLTAVHLEHSDLRDAIPGGMRAGGLQIDDREGLGEQPFDALHAAEGSRVGGYSSSTEDIRPGARAARRRSRES